MAQKVQRNGRVEGEGPRAARLAFAGVGALVVQQLSVFLTLRAAKHMARHDLEYGIVTMCIGGGQALAALLRRI